MRLFCLLAIIGCNGGPLDTEDLERGAPPAAERQPASLKRLTDQHYKNTIASLFGEGIALPDKLDPVDQVDGLVAVGAALGTISPVGTERYESAAYQVAEQVMTDEALRSSVLICEPANTVDVECARACRDTS